MTGQALAQTIYVLNEATREPVEGAIIYDENQVSFVESDDDGAANLSVFPEQANLIIQHPSFHQYAFSKTEVNGLKILLKERVIKIDEVIISANKWEQKKSEVPFEILSLGAGEMDFDNVLTAADALEATGQVFVQKSQLGGGSPMIRGFGANAVLIVVDGVRMNNTIFRGGNLQNIINIDPNALESSEVIFGPGTVIYGSDALGGVMDFHTLKPMYAKDNSTKISGHGMMRYSSANNEKTGSFQLSIGRKKWAYLGNVSFSDFDDLRTGSVRPKEHPVFGKRPEYVQTIQGRDSVILNNNENLQRFSGYQQFSTLQKLAFRINGQSELSYTFNYSSTSDIPRYDRLIQYSDDQLTYAKWYYGPQTWIMNALKFKYYKPSLLFDAMKLTTAYQFFEESRHDRKYRSTNLRNRTEKVGVLTVNMDFEKDLNSNNHIYYGGEYIFNHVNSSAFSENVETGELSDLSTRYPDGGSDVHGAAIYFSYKRSIKDHIHLSTGLRYNYQALSAKFAGNQFYYDIIENNSSALNGNIGLVYQPSPTWNVSGMLSTGFRAPNIDDISKVFDSEPGNVVVPNPDLKPEYSYNAEVSIAKVIHEKLKVNGTVFYSFLRDAMVRGDFNVNGQDSIIYDGVMSNVQAMLNTGRANIYGFSLGLKADFSATWAAVANINVTEGRDLETDEPLRHTTPIFGMASVKYNKEKFRAELFVRFNGKRTLENLPPSERNKTQMYTSDGSLAWYTLNLRTQYHFNHIFSCNAAVENILDHHYRTYSSGISAPGRNFILSLKAIF